MSLIPVDFSLVTHWEVDSNGPKWADGTPKYITDKKMDQNYWNETKRRIRTKCALLTSITPLVHLVALICNLAFRIYNVLSTENFYVKKNGREEFDFAVGISKSGDDILRIVATPFAYIALELSAIYGIFRPLDGRKLYASLERAMYEQEIFAPCFQPSPRYHAFGGDPNVRDSF